MPGVVVVNQQGALSTVIDDLVLLAECSTTDEWKGQIIYLSLP